MLPGGLEGYYRVDLRSMDTFDNRTDTTQGRGLWNSMLDNIAPRAELRYQITTVGPGQQVHYEFSAHDFGLVEQGLVWPCPATALSREYFNAPWYRARTGQTAPSSGQLWALSGQCDLAYTGTPAQFTVCDLAGNCTTQNATPLATTTEAEAFRLGRNCRRRCGCSWCADPRTRPRHHPERHTAHLHPR